MVSPRAQAGPVSLDFVLGIGGTDQDLGESVAVASTGFGYVTGSFEGTVDFDPGAGTTNLTANGFQDAFLAKYNSSGDLQWVRQFGGSSIFTGSDSGITVIVDVPYGNVYLQGVFTGTVDFDPGAGVVNLVSANSGASTSRFLIHLDGSGNLNWATAINTNNIAPSYGGLAVESPGKTHLIGSFYGTTDFDPGTGTNNLTSTDYDPAAVSGGGADVYLQELDVSGNFVSAMIVFPAGNRRVATGRSIQLDSAGNIYVGGYFENDENDTVRDIFITKISSAGSHLWTKTLGGSLDDLLYGIALDASGNVHATGEFRGTVDFNPGAGTFNMTSAGSNDAFILKLDASGDFVWAKQLGGSSFDLGVGLTVDDLGTVFTTGWFFGTVDFDPGDPVNNLNSLGGYDTFVSILDSDGEYLWVEQISGTSLDVSSSLSLITQLSMYLTGSFFGATDFDPDSSTTVSSSGGTDIFLAKYDFADSDSEVVPNDWTGWQRM